MKDISSWIGQWALEIRENGKVKDCILLTHNLLTDEGLNMFRDALRGGISDLEIKYVALGNGSASPLNADTQLLAEQFRKGVTAQDVDPIIAGKLYTELYISDMEANDFKCEEIGWFAGVGATMTVNSGICIARILYSRQKYSTESWTIRRTDSISRG